MDKTQDYREEMKKNAKKEAGVILDAFIKELEKVADTKIDEMENENCKRNDRVVQQKDDNFSDRFLDSVPTRKGRFVGVEKKSW